jgi:hypothetical protein
VNTTTKPSYAQPAVIGGVIMGVLSALPVIAVGNVCCCLWLISGGAVAAYLLQQNQTAPLTPADGALVGLMAGVIGAFVRFAVGIPIDFMLAPMEHAMLQRVLDMGTLPPEMRNVLEQYAGRDRELSGAFYIVSSVVGLMFWLFLGAIFSTIGGLIGALIFRTQTPPAAIDIPPSA